MNLNRCLLELEYVRYEQLLVLSLLLLQELNKISDPFFKFNADTANCSAVVPLDVVDAYLHPI